MKAALATTTTTAACFSVDCCLQGEATCHSFYCEQWNTGITPGFEALDYFSLFINDDLLNYFVAETIRFAEQFISASATRRRSRVNDWYPTDPNEMRQFLGQIGRAHV